MMPRRDIESREAPAIAAELKAALDKFCAAPRSGAMKLAAKKQFHAIKRRNFIFSPPAAP